MPVLSKLEDVFVQIIRLVLLAFSAVVLVALAMLLIGKLAPSPSSTSSEPAVVWKDVKPDMQYVVEETGRDMGLHVPNQQLQERLTDPQLRPAFQKADQLLRDFVALKPALHERIEKDNEARGLAPVNPLLVGDAMPSPQAVKAYAQAQEQARNASDASDAAQAVEAVEASDEATAADAAAHAAAQATAAADAAMQDCCWTDPVDVPQILHERASQVQSEYGEPAYAAFVLGAPAAIEKVLTDPGLAPKLHEQTMSRLVDMVITNYSISFSRAVDVPDADSSESLWDSIFNSIELTMWSVILSFLVLVVFVVMVIRIEKHLRLLNLQHTPRP